MIDFQNGSYLKLKKVNDDTVIKQLQPLFIPGEELIGTYKTVRDSVTFTNKRILAVNVQGLTGKKKDFTSIPYSKITVFSIETSGHFDMDSELDVFLSGVGRVRFEFTGNSDILLIGNIISQYLL